MTSAIPELNRVLADIGESYTQKGVQPVSPFQKIRGTPFLIQLASFIFENEKKILRNLKKADESGSKGLHNDQIKTVLEESSFPLTDEQMQVVLQAAGLENPNKIVNYEDLLERIKRFVPVNYKITPSPVYEPPVLIQELLNNTQYEANRGSGSPSEVKESKNPFAARNNIAEGLFKMKSSLLSKPEWIASVTVTYDNKHIISASKDIIAVWDIENQKFLHQIDVHLGLVTSLTVTTDGKFIISGSTDLTVAVWEIADQRIHHIFEEVHSKCITSVTVSKDREYILSGSEDRSIAVLHFTKKNLYHRFKEAHRAEITSVAITHENTYIVSGSKDKTIGLWSNLEKKLHYRFDDAHSGPVTSITVSGDKYIVSASTDKSIKLWSIKQRKLHHKFENKHSDWVTAVAVTSDHKYLVSGSADKTLAVWDIERQTLHHQTKGEELHMSPLTAVSVSPDGNTIVSGSLDNTIVAWDIATKKISYRFAYKMVVAVSNERFIVGGSMDWSIKIWEIAGKKLYHQFERAHNDAVTSVAVMGDFIVSGSDDRSIGVWSILEKKLHHRFSEAHSAGIISISGSYPLIVSGSKNGSLKLWSIEKKRMMASKQGLSGCLSLAMTAEYVIVGSTDHTVGLWSWSADELKDLHKFEGHHGWVTCVDITGDNLYIVSGSADNTVQVWNIPERSHYHLFHAHSDMVTSVAVSKDSNYFASGSYDKTIKIWDLKEKKVLYQFKEGLSFITSVAMCGTKYLISGSKGNRVQYWNIMIEKLVKRFEIQNKNVASLTSDRKHLILGGSGEDLIELWDLEGEKKIFGFKRPSSPSILSLTVTADNKYVAAAYDDNVIRVWEFTTSALYHRFEEAALTAIALGNKSIVSASKDLSIKIWDIEKKSLYLEFSGAHSAAITCLAVSSDSKFIISGSADCSLGIWNHEANKFQSRIEEAHSADITALAVTDECKYVLSGSKDFSIGVWDFAQNKLYHRFDNAHSAEITIVAVTSDKKIIASGSSDCTIGVWNIDSKTKYRRFQKAHSAKITFIGVCSQSHIASASLDKSIKIWDFQKEAVIEQFQIDSIEATLVVVTPVDGHIVSCGSSDKKFRVWDPKFAERAERIAPAELPKQFSYQAMSDRANHILGTSLEEEKEEDQATEKNNPPTSSRENDMQFGRSSQSGFITERKAIEEGLSASKGTPSDRITSLVTTTDDRYTVSGSYRANIEVWDLVKCQRHFRFEEAHQGEITSIALTPDNNYIVSSSQDMSIGVWDISKKSLYHRFKLAHFRWITSVEVTNDNKYIASASMDKSIRVWDIGIKQLYYTFEDAHSDWVTSIGTAKEYIVSGSADSTIKVWNIAQKSLIHHFKAPHSSSITSVVISSDNKYILSGSANCTIGVWDVEEKRPLHRFQESRQQQVTSLTFTKDQKYIWSASKSNTAGIIVELWSFEGLMNVNGDDLTFYPRTNYLLGQLLLSVSNDFEAAFSKLQGVFYVPYRWNILNFIIFRLPDSANPTYIKRAIESKIYLIFDNYNWTPLDYILHYGGKRTAQTDEFFGTFFKNLPSLLNFNSLNRAQLFCSISKNAQKIFSNHGEMSFLDAFSSIYSKKISEYLDLDCVLPSSGLLNDNRTKEFIRFKGINIEKNLIQSLTVNGKDNFSLDYSLILYNCMYQITDPKTRQLLQIFKKIQSDRLLSPAIQNITELLWRDCKKLIWMKCILNGVLLGLFVSFIITEGLQIDAASQILIAYEVLVGILFLAEIFQVLAIGPMDYFKDVWNCVDMCFIASASTMSGIFWSDSSQEAYSFFASITTIFTFTRLLLAFRVIDQLRNLIRMIIEVLKDMISFFVVILVYLIAFAIVFYQSRRVISDDSYDSGNFGNDLMEMFYLIFTGGSYSEYSGIMIPFYLLVTVFQCLVLLNLIISIIAETYTRVKENIKLIDLREKISMLLEVAEEAHVTRILADKTQGKIKRICCCRRTPLVSALEAIEGVQESLNGQFLLVSEKFEIKDESELSIQDVDRRISSLEDNIFQMMVDKFRTTGDRFMSMEDKIKSMETHIVEKVALRFQEIMFERRGVDDPNQEMMNQKKKNLNKEPQEKLYKSSGRSFRKYNSSPSPQKKDKESIEFVQEIWRAIPGKTKQLDVTEDQADKLINHHVDKFAKRRRVHSAPTY